MFAANSNNGNSNVNNGFRPVLAVGLALRHNRRYLYIFNLDGYFFKENTEWSVSKKFNSWNIDMYLYYKYMKSIIKLVAKWRKFKNMKRIEE
ncbi:MAG: hypothetical protein PHP54_04725 [Clostridia bacterium]|nr:hypothetical protein [Clostridia bacterium]